MTKSKTSHRKNNSFFLTAILSAALPFFTSCSKGHNSGFETPEACSAPTAVNCGVWASVLFYNPPLVSNSPQVTLATTDATVCSNTSGLISILTTATQSHTAEPVTTSFVTPLFCSMDSGMCTCNGYNNIPDPGSDYPESTSYMLSLSCVAADSGLVSTYAEANVCLSGN